MRLFAAIVFGLAFLSLARSAGEPSGNSAVNLAHPAAPTAATPLDWRSNEVRIETSGNLTRVVVHRRTFKGIRHIEVHCNLDDSTATATLVYWVNTYVGHMTVNGFHFERSDVNVVWTFDSEQFKKMKAERRFFIVCKGDTGDVG